MISNNGDEAIIPSSSSSKDIPSSTSSKNSNKDFEKVLNKIDGINWDDCIKKIEWEIDSDNDEDIIAAAAVNAAIPSTSNNNKTLLNLNKNSAKKQNGSMKNQNVKIVEDGIQPCSSKTPIRITNGSEEIILEEMPSTSNNNRFSGLKVGLEHRKHLPPQTRHKHPYVS